MKRASFHVLLALADGPRHGFGILRDVEEQTGGSVRLWPVTLYGTLETLAEQGLIEELGPEERPPGESEKKRYYRLTELGQEALHSEADRMARLSRLARSRLRGAT